MRYVLLLLFILSSGCVLNRPINTVYYSEVHTERAASATQAPVKETKRKKAVVRKKAVAKQAPVKAEKTCPEFVLPPVGKAPVTPVFSNPDAKLIVDEDAILAMHIKEMRQYAVDERARVREAYREWKKSCMEKD
ncbi:hypothetical protein MZD04_gp213 [Pseudomonas phage Psa21]|uniref:Lipoprotein n=1 Tax=Pseudomonas phage Psa21 TaxID=2530023 RepID=A0A481W4I8_9CAUD|nr:hypothetical protein MZD04_gp213 [Pseudomonas phage Psa21]QBJ02739.1 hypothetical protein PSA21_213 [Pseudomonas phage Psa21]